MQSERYMISMSCWSLFWSFVFLFLCFCVFWYFFFFSPDIQLASLFRLVSDSLMFFIGGKVSKMQDDQNLSFFPFFRLPSL